MMDKLIYSAVQVLRGGGTLLGQVNLPAARCRGGIDAADLLPKSLVHGIAQERDCSAGMDGAVHARDYIIFSMAAQSRILFLRDCGDIGERMLI